MRPILHRIVRSALLGMMTAVLLTMAGCGNRGTKSETRETKSVPQPSTAQVSPPASSSSAPNSPKKSSRDSLLTRKGELLMEQRRVRGDPNLSLAQKDSILRDIEKESVQLSKKLLETAK